MFSYIKTRKCSGLEHIETFALFNEQFTRQVTPSPSPHTVEGKPQISDVDCLLWAVGRDANIVDLGIDQMGVKLDRRGFIEVDEYQNTSVTNMYALGGVAGKKLLTPGEGVRVIYIYIYIYISESR